MFTNIPQKDVLILDNFIYSFSLDIENGIPIKPYYNGKDDYELEYLMHKLMLIKDEPEDLTLVDFINKVLKLDKFYSYLGTKKKGLLVKKKKIARRSVVVGLKPESAPKSSQFLSSTRSMKK